MESTKIMQRPVNRRSFLKGGLLAGGAATLGAGLLGKGVSAFAQESSSTLNSGDIAILRFLAAAELLESDLWTQYAELGGIGDQLPVEVATPNLNPYQAALSNLDGDGPQYISSNTLDEISHATFLNAYLESRGADPVDLDAFRTLPGSRATGSSGISRLTNLTQLNVDTSWFVRYRSTASPDLGATFPQAITLNNVPAIPVTDADLFGPANHIQAIANIAAFHFGSIEQGGSSLYAAMSQKVSSTEVLQITLGIGGDEIAHFLEWVDFSGNGVQPPIAPFSDHILHLTFPNFFSPLNPLSQPSLIFPVPAQFISRNLPRVATIRPVIDKFAGARATVNFLTNEGLFIGQTKEFFQTLQTLADQADIASRQC